MRTRPGHPLSLEVAAPLLMVLLTACVCDPDPPLCAETKSSLTLPELEAGWCTQPQQAVTPEGYCECTDSHQRFDKESGACRACTPAACADNECGSDGCDGSCGRCRAGLVCANGKCLACAGQCNGRQCGDDGCGRACGTCDAGSVCEEGRCVAKDTSQVITDCTCADTPPGAFPGARRFEAQCATGQAQFELCTNKTCGVPHVTAWRETCFTVPTGAPITWCNCFQPPDSVGQRVDTPVCSEKVARLMSCGGPCFCGMDPYGNPISCPWPAWYAQCDTC
ncbi:uncharacterized protein STAUR_7953 [Stigmatella aurantiaca DW4/3-1]|uniref:Uncharacterized protein n=1 Tax=Stigmatella aurantiaca (strain DW4/3-1) TaxID=378806 RepID=E3FQ05_STIAD|nr:uncharacterized protein STAUR_7953 [Stigmatella aurantiaca DW4/3-1]